MNKKKIIYIFVAHSISMMGGMELYTSGMTQYLESQGCLVRVLTPDPSKVVPIISSLKKYIERGGDCYFLMKPPYRFNTLEQEVFIKEMIEKLDLPPNLEDYNIFIESCAGQRALWAELIAAKLNAHHFFIASEENYREDWQCYAENLPFFYFKWQRSEIVCAESTIKKLFNGYRNVEKPKTLYPHITREADPVQDVDYPDLDNTPPVDWIICHIGRHGKSYVPHMIDGIGEFARRHPDKTILFVCVGDMKAARSLIQEKFNGLNNMYVGFSGILSPLPRVLFSKVDVVIGISQTAIFSAHEGAKTIVASATMPEKTPGLLGYDTQETIFGEGKFTYAEALENVLVKRIYKDKEFFPPELQPAEEAYKNIWQILENISKVPKEYYTEIATPKLRDAIAAFPFGYIARGARIIIYGYNEIAIDYIRQINSQKGSMREFGHDYVKSLKPAPYCEIVAIVDENPENFGNEIFHIDRLKEMDYDAIVIALPLKEAHLALGKIQQTIPQATNLVVYNLQPIAT